MGSISVVKNVPAALVRDGKPIDEIEIMATWVALPNLDKRPESAILGTGTDLDVVVVGLDNENLGVYVVSGLKAERESPRDKAVRHVSGDKTGARLFGRGSSDKPQTENIVANLSAVKRVRTLVGMVLAAKDGVSSQNVSNAFCGVTDKKAKDELIDLLLPTNDPANPNAFVMFAIDFVPGQPAMIRLIQERTTIEGLDGASRRTNLLSKAAQYALPL